jgi:L-fucose isomerase-like protein
MHLPLGAFSPDVRVGLVSASRNCFPRSLSEERMGRLRDAAQTVGVSCDVPDGDCQVIETKEHARKAAQQLEEAGCDGVVLYLGNFSPELEDATFVKNVTCPVMVIAAAEESADTLAEGRGDALCGLLSATMAIRRRNRLGNVYMPEQPLVTASTGAQAIKRFARIVKVVKGMRNATLGLYGPRPRDFETCNYNVSALAGIGVEVEEFGFFDLVREVEHQRASDDVKKLTAEMAEELGGGPEDEFMKRLAAYELAVNTLRERLGLSGMTTQCWTEQEDVLRHVPCYVNARMAARGFPIACENDAYSLTAELLGQYASEQSVTILDVNHTIPSDLAPILNDYPHEDLAGFFHCGNTDPRRMKNTAMKYQVIMHRLMEPDQEPDMTRGTLEGQIAASPITVLQVQSTGDRLCAYLCEGEFLDLDPRTFGGTGTAYIPGFRRFYRHVLLGRFHHHAAIAFDHVGGIAWDALKLLGVETIYAPLGGKPLYESENPFEAS